MFCSLFYTIVPFPERSDNLLKQHASDLSVFVSGSISQYYDGKCNPSNPDHVTDSTERKTDWCSNINKSKTDSPWFSMNVRGKSISLTGYSLRMGCCYYGTCCLNTGEYIRCCLLYSWSLQGSHDNSTWIDIHKIEKDRDFYYCQNRIYEVKSESFEYIRIIQNEAYPGCAFCICLNKLELYGSVSSSSSQSPFNIDNDDSISIIGKLSKRGNI
jgi:hypothetical protein